MKVDNKIKNSFSVIIPVYKEKESVNLLIKDIQELSKDYKTQIIVIDGDSEGETLEIIDDNNIIKLISQKGRAFQMNLGSERSTGDILLFLHCDTFLPAKAFDLM